MKIMCEVVTPYICNKCGGKNLYFRSKNDYTIINYKSLIESGKSLHYIKNMLNKYNIDYIYCPNCGNKSLVNWNDGYPKQLDDSIIKRFEV